MSSSASQPNVTSLDRVLSGVTLPVAVYDRQLTHVYRNSAYAAALNDVPAPSAAASVPPLRLHAQFFECLETYVEQRGRNSVHGFPLCDSEGRLYLVEMLFSRKVTREVQERSAAQAQLLTRSAAEGINLDPLHAAWVTARLSAPGTELAPPMDLRGRLEKIEGLPCMSSVAQRILTLGSNPNASVNDLARTVEIDPMLAAQLLRWASSPFYGKRGKITSIEDAIKTVGFDLVLNLALGVASLKALRVPKEGPLGLTVLWRHAVYAGTLMSLLAERVTAGPRPPSGVAYLTGLMHNIGLFLLGHQFPREFSLLSLLVSANPGMSITALEKFIFGTDHARLGTWLLTLWGLPSDICIAVAHHHNPAYAGNQRTLAQLTLLADHALATAGQGEGNPSAELMTSCCDALGIAETKVTEMLERVLERSDMLDAFVQQTAGN